MSEVGAADSWCVLLKRSYCQCWREKCKQGVLFYYTLRVYDWITLHWKRHATKSSPLHNRVKVQNVCTSLLCIRRQQIINQFCYFLLFDFKGLRGCVAEPSIKAGASHFLTYMHLEVHKKAFHTKWSLPSENSCSTSSHPAAVTDADHIKEAALLKVGLVYSSQDTVRDKSPGSVFFGFSEAWPHLYQRSRAAIDRVSQVRSKSLDTASVSGT